MSIFPGRVRTHALCAYCNGIATIPPGVYYQGEPHCRMCAIIRRLEDNSDAYQAPVLDHLEEVLEELIDADRSVNPWA